MEAERKKRCQGDSIGCTVLADVPSHTIPIPYSLMPEGSNFALDIGGSLAKVAYVPRAHTCVKGKPVNLHLVTFDMFDTDSLDQCLDYIKSDVIGNTNHVDRNVKATGVGSLKFTQKICDDLSIDLHVDCNELQYMARGIDVLWRLLPPDKLLHPGSDVHDCVFECPLVNSGLLPCILVSMGSAMTVVEVSADGSTSGIIGGSSQGGLTFLGLGALLTSAKSFRELMDLAEKGDRKKVDLLVKDTAGAEYNAGSEDMVSSFGKVAKHRASGEYTVFKEEDVANSLLFSITDQMAQTACLIAKAHNMHRVVFCGTYLANQTIIQQIKSKFARSVRFTQHELSPVFLRHEGYLGAIGLLFNKEPQEECKA